ncbi:MAG: NADH-quinone oxidoreductase subunit [Bacteroidota bacterium]
MTQLAIGIVLLPFTGFVLLGILGKSLFKKQSGLVGSLLSGLSCLLAFLVAYQYFFVSHQEHEAFNMLVPFRVEWLGFANGLSIDMGILLDPLSVMMLVVVTLVSFMVHVYSMEYLDGEERYPTYYAFLSLFTFSMLGLVLSTNIFQIYIFWELVGVSSFLLIGFYYQKPSARAASKKAFIVTRFADLGFLIGILILSFYGNSLDIDTLIHRLTSSERDEMNVILQSGFLGISAFSWGLLLIFIGGAGKSAMFPLHIWLPDAMEGPTPVSALIHAATMVVAGVYLVARLFPVYSSDEGVMQVITYVGVLSAFWAAIVACTQTDIKRVLAYSTMSQIGYMMFALGVARYEGEEGLGFTASLFHLFTHALFKALLFLGAGAVIHYVHSNEMKDMGGLRKRMPVTHITFLIACLSISGIPFFSGFYSKEEILLAASRRDSLVYTLALITSGLTAFYMFRLYYRIFWNKESAMGSSAHSHGEGGWRMMGPLLLLAGGSLLSGYIPFGKFVSFNGQEMESTIDYSFSLMPVALALVGITVATVFYRKPSMLPDRLTGRLKGLYRLANHKFYIDEFYLFITHKVLFNGIARPASWIDKNIVDGLVNASGQAALQFSEAIKKIQSGKLQHYTMYFLAAVVAIAAVFIYWM